MTIGEGDDLGPLSDVLERRLQEAMGAYRRLTDEIVLLRKAQETILRLQALADESPSPTGPTDPYPISSRDDPHLIRFTDTLGASDHVVITIKEDRGREPKRRRANSLDPQGSTARVVMLVESSADAVVLETLVAEFKRRQWIDPAWSRPEDAVAQAARRAVKRGSIRQLSDKRFVAAPHPLRSPATSDACELRERSVDATGARLIDRTGKHVDAAGPNRNSRTDTTTRDELRVEPTEPSPSGAAAVVDLTKAEAVVDLTSPDREVPSTR